MSVHFTKEHILARPDAGFYSQDKLTLLKRIFENACNDAHITDKIIRDELANKLLIAGKDFEDEDRLITFMKKAIAQLRR